MIVGRSGWLPWARQSASARPAERHHHDHQPGVAPRPPSARRARRRGLRLVPVSSPSPARGQLSSATVHVVDPYMRGRMNDTKSYVPPFAARTSRWTAAPSASRRRRATAGGRSLGDCGSAGATDALVRADAAPRRRRPASAAGLPRRARHARPHGVRRPAATRASSGRRDGVHLRGRGRGRSLVGQIARLKGAAPVIGSAGGPAKTRVAAGRAGFDAAVDYKDAADRRGPEQAAPDGIDVYFDNVGGDTSRPRSARCAAAAAPPCAG